MWERAFIKALDGVVINVVTVRTVGIDLLGDRKLAVLLAVKNALTFAAAF